MRIALCGGDAYVTERLSRSIARYAFDRNAETTLGRFTQGVRLPGQDWYDPLIPDPRMENMDGIELAGR